jgi:hypothetical protein
MKYFGFHHPRLGACFPGHFRQGPAVRVHPQDHQDDAAEPAGVPAAAVPAPDSGQGLVGRGGQQVVHGVAGIGLGGRPVPHRHALIAGQNGHQAGMAPRSGVLGPHLIGNEAEKAVKKAVVK